LILLMVALGGAAGALGRYALGRWVHTRLGGGLPWATLAVNVVGGFLLGCTLPLLAVDPAMTPLRAFVTVGCLGAFTTFSGFAYEAAVMLRLRTPGLAGAYAVASVGLSLGALVLGLATAAAVLSAGG
jgi:fluoride exporter